MKRIVGLCAVSLALLLAGALPLLTQITQPVLAETDTELSPASNFDVSSAFEGKASWYGPGFDGRLTASGEIFSRYALTAAHRTLRHGSVVRVTNLRNGNSTLLVINDWGPVPADRVIDVSETAADLLGFHHQGVAPVRVEVLRASVN